MLSVVPSQDFLARIPTVLDNSILSTFRNCQHKALYAYIEDLKPVAESINLHAGACFARGNEVVYRSLFEENKSLEEALADGVFALQKAWGNFVVKSPTNKTRPRCEEALFSYAMEYKGRNDHIQPSHLFSNPFEYSFAIPLTYEAFGYDFPLHPATGEPFIYAGKFDMIGEEQSFLRIRDDKTCTQLGSKWADKWTLRSQFMGYCRSMQILGADVDTCEIRGVCFLKDSITHARAVKTFTRDQLNRWVWQIFRDVTALVNAATSGEWEWNFSDICEGYGGCPYLDLCRAKEPANYFDSFVRRRWNPLELHVETAESIGA